MCALTRTLKSTLLAAAVGAVVASAGSTRAATITWNLNLPSGLLGTTQTYTAGGITITAAGFSGIPQLGTNTPNVMLFGKNNGGDEVGLGLSNDPSGENEISGLNIIRIDFSNVITAGALPFSFDFQMNSTTGTVGANIEAWAVWDSFLPSGFAGPPLMTGTDENPHSGLQLFPFYFFTVFPGNSGNVLIANVSAEVPGVPEPSTWAMMLLGFAGLGFVFKQSRRKVSLA
jgi:hypothetical protein